MMKKNGLVRRKIYILIFLLVLLSCVHFMTGCSQKLMTDYDADTEKLATQTYEKISSLFINLKSKVGTQEANFNNYEKDYNTIEVQLDTLQMRASAFPKNKQTQEMIKELEKQINTFETLHKEKDIFTNQDRRETGIKAIEQAKRGIQTTVTAILKLEIAKKRGETSSEGSTSK